MTRCILIVLFVFFQTEVFSQEKDYDRLVRDDSVFEANVKRIKDSFATSNIDTFMFFERRCSGCIRGYNKEVYFFWLKDERVQYFKLSKWTGRSEIVGTFGVFSYYLKIIASLESEVLDTKIYAFHYDYSVITFSINKTEFNSTIPMYYLVSNETSSLVNLIYMVESRIRCE